MKFVKKTNESDFDSLTFSIYFTDGDMDLGLDNSDLDSPYHRYNYFIATGNSKLVKVSTDRRNINLPSFVRLPPGLSGKLVTPRTRNEPGYDYLPPARPYDCTKYNFTQLNISEEDIHIIDDSYHISDTLTGGPTLPDVYILKDTFYYEPNPTYYNIDVDWLVKNDDGTYEEFDFLSEYCFEIYGGRFPRLDDLQKTTKIDAPPFEIRGLSRKKGVLTFNLMSSYFKGFFPNKTLKLRIMIYDRALHESNIVESDDFTFE